MSSWSASRWLVSVAVGGLTALLIAIPTGIIHTPFYTRMTPVLWWNYPIWAISAVLAGLLAGTYGARNSKRGGVTGRVSVGGMMSLLAVGCPICNKVVVALLGASGALGIWAPIQPILGLASVGFLAFALWLRLRAPATCDLPSKDNNSDAATVS